MIRSLAVDRDKAVHRNAPLIRTLQEELRSALAAAVPEPGDYAILDFPNHPNVGDSAIFSGELRLCREHFGRDPVLVTEAGEHDLELVARLDPAVVLLCHGGGNFGDLYPRHQAFREALVRRFPDRRIIFLPQSVHYEDEARIAGSAEALRAHPALTIMVRDLPSREIVEQRIGVPAMLVPDPAFMLGPLDLPEPPRVRLIGLMRKDRESAPRVCGGAPQPDLSLDWPAEEGTPSLLERLPWHARKRMPPRWQGRRPVTPPGFAALADRRLRRGLQLLARGEIVVTDRLHGHILSILLGIPHIVLDNTYGKIARFSSLWTRGASFEVG